MSSVTSTPHLDLELCAAVETGPAELRTVFLGQSCSPAAAASLSRGSEISPTHYSPFLVVVASVLPPVHVRKKVHLKRKGWLRVESRYFTSQVKDVFCFCFILSQASGPQRQDWPSTASQSSETVFYQLIPGNRQLRVLASALLFCFPKDFEL